MIKKSVFPKQTLIIARIFSPYQSGRKEGRLLIRENSNEKSPRVHTYNNALKIFDAENMGASFQ